VRLIRDAQNLPEELRVLDLCTGTGCIPLLFRHEFYEARRDIVVRALGVDVADRALKLASHNLRRMRRLISWVDQGDVDFMKADILTNPFHDMGEGPLSFKIAINRQRRLPFWDILISNPPYISPSEYWKTTTRSVRGFEPKLALVPPSSSPNETDTQLGDRFYGPLLTIAHDVEAKIMLLEVADLDQALRVAHKVRDFTNFVGVEIWRDQPSAEEDTAPTSIDGIPIVGQGNVRSVICWRGLGTQWLGKSSKVCLHLFPFSP
jgi:methylase of polypeptide subunit release factors